MAKPTLFYARAWLVLAQGGWWKCSEILAGIPDELRNKDANARLWFMSRTGYIVRRDIPPERRPETGRSGPRERVEYAVTGDCLVPQGITAGALSEALLGRPLA